MLLKIRDIRDIEAVPAPDHVKTTVRYLVDNTMSRKFQAHYIVIEPGGYGAEPPHTHPEEHLWYIVRGKGIVRAGQEEKEVKEGMIVFIPAGEVHSMRNIGDQPLELISIKC
jgi:mannose-6-phosphate isomerase-like protein (cupin superfamily)